MCWNVFAIRTHGLIRTAFTNYSYNYVPNANKMRRGRFAAASSYFQNISRQIMNNRFSQNNYCCCLFIIIIPKIRNVYVTTTATRTNLIIHYKVQTKWYHFNRLLCLKPNIQWLLGIKCADWINFSLRLFIFSYPIACCWHFWSEKCTNCSEAVQKLWLNKQKACQRRLCL